MGKTARLEYLRRILPLCLAVLGIAGWFYFMTLLSSIMCLVARGCDLSCAATPAAGIRSNTARVAPVCPDAGSHWFWVRAVFSAACSPWSRPRQQGPWLPWLCFACFRASLSLIFFTVAVRQETSWVRFFGNGFEFTQFGLRVRVPYTALEKVSVKQWHASGPVAWFQSTVGSSGRKTAVLLNGQETTKTLVFRRDDGATFTISSETHSGSSTGSDRNGPCRSGSAGGHQRLATQEDPEAAGKNVPR